ncbi:MAG: DUF2059 domain-containing protein, partial [Deltaproteobacteria bacterium]|nr:DUF2059 domain-containing protein [Deltaproteobacteria bacterium]
MTRIQGQVVGGMVKPALHSESKFPSFIFIYLAFLIIFPVSSFAQTSKISAEKKTVIKAMLLRTPQFSEKQNRNVAQRMIDVYKAGNPNLSPRAFQIALEEVRLNNRKLLEQLIPIYDKFFTLKELRSMSNFSNSKVSHKFNRVMPLMMQKEAALKNPGLSAEQKAKIYNKYFTPEELRSISDFYNTQVGRKMSRVMPQITKELMQARQS